MAPTRMVCHHVHVANVARSQCFGVSVYRLHVAHSCILMQARNSRCIQIPYTYSCEQSQQRQQLMHTDHADILVQGDCTNTLVALTNEQNPCHLYTSARMPHREAVSRRHQGALCAADVPRRGRCPSQTQCCRPEWSTCPRINREPPPRLR